MIEEDLVLAKVATVDRCMRRIAHATEGKASKLDDLDAQDIFVLNLQRAVQATIDLAHHLVASEGLGLPTTLKEAFNLLQQESGLSKRLAIRMQAMVGFRNIAVHDYRALDPIILKTILTDHLEDLRDFCRFALDMAKLNDETLVPNVETK
ncbi:MAG: DUF86 domain-containing protein [Deltaproteobacteria bacterium]|nr:DUF86 domain-containing protein [Deltaproteobacteria bacterium]